MKIAFDAKRIFQNTTGLGHYSRTLVSSLSEYFPLHEYYLCAPTVTSLFKFSSKNMHVLTPQDPLTISFKSLWRSNLVNRDLQKKGIDIYHGLSHEIPFGIHKKEIKSVVTIHDLIFERYPQQYSFFDVRIHRNKIKYACRNADKVIAISQQTKNDLVELYNVPKEKITVCYQSCNPAFSEKISDAEKRKIKDRYKLPDRFFLYVGSIIERKNLLNVCKAIDLIKDQLDIPLVVIGNGKKYKQQVKEYINQNKLESRVVFLSDEPIAQSDFDFKTAKVFPGIYQMATCMIYPSIYEGFGIPVLEALSSELPVITSNISCLPETGGDAAYYIDPFQPQEIADALLKIISDKYLVSSMKERGLIHAKKFSQQTCASSVMKVYDEIMGKNKHMKL